MHFTKDERGVGLQATILFGTLVLAVVLLNGIAINVKQNEKAQNGKNIAVGYCGLSHKNLPPECTITEVFNCGDHYILKNDCLGTGDIILTAGGAFQAWCGYTSLDGAAMSCQPYWRDPQGRDCQLTKNLCKK